MMSPHVTVHTSISLHYVTIQLHQQVIYNRIQKRYSLNADILGAHLAAWAQVDP